MSKPFGIAFGAAVVVIAVLVGIGFHNTKGNHLGSHGRYRETENGEGRRRYNPDGCRFQREERFGPRHDRSQRGRHHRYERWPACNPARSPLRTPLRRFAIYPLLGRTIQSRDEGARRRAGPPDARPDGLPAFRSSPTKKWKRAKSFALHVEDVTGPVLELKK